MLRKALLGLVVTVLALGAVEAGLRAVYRVDALLFEWERPAGLIAVSDAGDVVTRPGMDQAREDGPYRWRIHLDSLGFREDTDVPREKPADKQRILALGDSWIFGYSVDQGATIPDVLEALLPAATGQPVEVVNAGVFGASAFDMLVRYRQLVEVYRPDAVLLGQPHNVRQFGADGGQRDNWYRSVREGPASTMRTYLIVRWWLAPVRAGLYADPPQGAGREPEFADIRLLASDAEDRGIPVYFVEMPNRLADGLEGFPQRGEWRNGLRGTSVMFGGHALDERSCWGFLDEGHPSAAGAWSIAAAMVPVFAHSASQEVTSEPKCSSNPAPGPGKAPR